MGGVWGLHGQLIRGSVCLLPVSPHPRAGREPPAVYFSSAAGSRRHGASTGEAGAPAHPARTRAAQTPVSPPGAPPLGSRGWTWTGESGGVGAAGRKPPSHTDRHLLPGLQGGGEHVRREGGGLASVSGSLRGCRLWHSGCWRVVEISRRQVNLEERLSNSEVPIPIHFLSSCSKFKPV